jgi:hypothetical protein
MGWRVELRPGTYYAGVDRPWFASRDAVQDRASSEGFGPIEWHDRDEGNPPVNPRADPKSNMDASWDEWVRVRYLGRPRVVDLPQRPPWVVYWPDAMGPAPGAPRAPDAPPAPPGPVPAPLAVEEPTTAIATDDDKPGRDAAGAFVAVGVFVLATLIKLGIMASRRA